MPFSTRKAVIPCGPFDTSLLAYTMSTFASGPFVIQNLLPFSTQLLPAEGFPVVRNRKLRSICLTFLFCLSFHRNNIRTRTGFAHGQSTHVLTGDKLKPLLARKSLSSLQTRIQYFRQILLLLLSVSVSH